MNEYANILLGAIVGWVIPYMFKFLVFIIKMCSKNPLYGNWFLYLWWTNNGNVEFVEMKAIIKRGILYAHKIKCWDNGSCFTGTVKIEDNNLCINMKGDDTIQKTSTCHRYDLSTLEKRDRLYGFWLSFDADNSVSCGGAILTRERLEEDDRENIVKKNYKINRNYPVISVR